MRIVMRYGKEGFPLELPDDLDVAIIRKKAMPVLPTPARPSRSPSRTPWAQGP